jgi:hypothetical protein
MHAHPPTPTLTLTHTLTLKTAKKKTKSVSFLEQAVLWKWCLEQRQRRRDKDRDRYNGKPHSKGSSKGVRQEILGASVHRKSDAQALPETQAEYTDLMKSHSDNKTTRHLSAEQKRTETQHRPDHPLK